MMMVGSHTPRPSCGQELPWLWWWWMVGHWRVGESISRSPSSSRVPSTTGQCSSSPPPLDPPPFPPEGECVTACHSLDLFAAWLGWHVIGRRERWVEELALHPTLHLLSRPPTPSKQAHGLVACTSKRMGLARPIEYLGQQCCCGRGQSTSSTLECLPSLHRDGPLEP